MINEIAQLYPFSSIEMGMIVVIIEFAVLYAVWIAVFIWRYKNET